MHLVLSTIDPFIAAPGAARRVFDAAEDTGAGAKHLHLQLQFNQQQSGSRAPEPEAFAGTSRMTRVQRQASPAAGELLLIRVAGGCLPGSWAFQEPVPTYSSSSRGRDVDVEDCLVASRSLMSTLYSAGSQSTGARASPPRTLVIAFALSHYFSILGEWDAYNRSRRERTVQVRV